MSDFQLGITVFLVALGTILTRFIAFIIFPKGRRVPKFVSYIGRALPPAVFGMLLVYCLKNVDVLSMPYGLPEFIALVFVAVLHIKWRQMLVSIAGGTILYMMLVQFVFI